MTTLPETNVEEKNTFADIKDDILNMIESYIKANKLNSIKKSSFGVEKIKLFLNTFFSIYGFKIENKCLYIYITSNNIESTNGLTLVDSIKNIKSYTFLYEKITQIINTYR